MNHTCPRCGHQFRSEGEVSDDQLSFGEEPEGQEHLPVLDEGEGVPDPGSESEQPVDSPSSSAVGEGEGQASGGSDDPPAAEDSLASAPSLSPTAPEYVQERLDVAYDKPPYRVPLMTEIRQVTPTGLTVLSTFSGCGGSCLGFKWAGFETLMASEFITAAVDSYLANFPDVPVAVGDVRDLEPAIVMERLGIVRGELDVLEGSPPCASFSTAGKREKHWGQVKNYSDTKQRTDDLFDEYIRLVDGFRPRVFVAENVAGFLYGAADHFRKWVEEMLRDLGYIVWVQLLDAAQHGVPQHRRRAIIIGVRKDVGIHPGELYPTPLPYQYSVRDAIGQKARVYHDSMGNEGVTEFGEDDPIHTIRTPGGGSNTRYVVEETIESVAASQGYEVHEQSPDEPAPTMQIVPRGYGGSGWVTEKVDPLKDLPGVGEQSSLEHDVRSERSLGEVSLDEPLRTPIIAGSKAGGQHDWKVTQDHVLVTEEDGREVVIERPPSGVKWFHREPVLDPDEPMDPIRAGTAQGGEGQDQLLWRVVGVSASGHGRRHVVKDPGDDAAPTIQTSPRGDEAGSGWVYELGTADEIAEASLESQKADPDKQYAIADEMEKLGPGEQSERYYSLVRADPEQPSPTVTQTGGTAGAASVVHPTQKRKFTIPELKRLCGFPDDFVLTGTYRQQWERMGRAVPPPMMYAIASKIRDALLKADADLDSAYDD